MSDYRGYQDKIVLMVEDDENNVFSMRMVLDELDLKVVSKLSGEEALIYLKDNDCDLILMDIRLPYMDGYETIAEIRKMPRFVKKPILAVTAQAFAEDREAALKSGADDYLAKPLEVDLFLEKVTTLLAS